MFRHASLLAATALFGALSAQAQTSSLEGTIKGFDGQPLKDAIVLIERTDIKGNYKTKSDKKGRYFHAGLPLGTYNLTVQVDGKTVDSIKGVRTRLGDPLPVDFDLQKIAAQQQAMQQAAQSGQLTEEMKRDMSPEQRAAIEKQMKEQQARLAKSKELNDAFNNGMTALQANNFAAAVEQLTKASELDPTQLAVWANLAGAYDAWSKAAKGAESDTALQKALELYPKVLEMKPDDAAVHNNYALALARAKKFQEAEQELAKAAALDPAGAGKYYYNLGAILVNTGQNEPAGTAFKKAIELDPNYADAHYQYGIYLTGKAQVAPDGSMKFPEGTREAFEKYLQLKPNGPFAESAKGMVETMGSKIETEYVNPDAKQQQKKAAPAKKK
jgi:tetratricopeptide (TPR) repeat protein